MLFEIVYPYLFTLTVIVMIVSIGKYVVVRKLVENMNKNPLKAFYQSNERIYFFLSMSSILMTIVLLTIRMVRQN